MPEKKFIKLILGKRYLLDTNVLIYSVDKSSPFYAKAKKVIEIGVPEKNILYINKESLEFEEIQTYRNLYNAVADESFHTTQNQT